MYSGRVERLYYLSCTFFTSEDHWSDAAAGARARGSADNPGGKMQCAQAECACQGRRRAHQANSRERSAPRDLRRLRPPHAQHVPRAHFASSPVDSTRPFSFHSVIQSFILHSVTCTRIPASPTPSPRTAAALTRTASGLVTIVESRQSLPRLARSSRRSVVAPRCGAAARKCRRYACVRAAQT